MVAKRTSAGAFEMRLPLAEFRCVITHGHLKPTGTNLGHIEFNPIVSFSHFEMSKFQVVSRRGSLGAAVGLLDI